jgi:hypothetical protein
VDEKKRCQRSGLICEAIYSLCQREQKKHQEWKQMKTRRKERLGSELGSLWIGKNNGSDMKANDTGRKDREEVIATIIVKHNGRDQKNGNEKKNERANERFFPSLNLQRSLGRDFDQTFNGRGCRDDGCCRCRRVAGNPLGCLPLTDCNAQGGGFGGAERRVTPSRSKRRWNFDL